MMIDLIRRSDALDCFHSWVDRYGDIHTPDEMAEYRAIEELPSVEQEKHTKKRTETHACDLIERQAAIDEIEERKNANGYRNVAVISELNRLEGYIMRLPSEQPEIVACGDCKHWICHDRRCGLWNHGVKPLDWCCHGERRTDE